MEFELTDRFLIRGNYCKSTVYKKLSKLGTHAKLNHKKRMFKKHNVT
ncbi:hypothetical protein LEP1GSC072_2030 [Leptospira noguchii str. Bonito]|nr:hypothetical protein LEP1GSC072_2030 [Leptospira noguchii str. Bonito]